MTKARARAIECPATWHADVWLAGIPQHGVYSHGSTLRALHHHLTQGLALAGVTAEVALVPSSPELERLRRAQAAAQTALKDAVKALAARGHTPRDIADATGATVPEVAALRSRRKARRPQKSQEQDAPGASTADA
jgi:hypothetical protein